MPFRFENLKIWHAARSYATQVYTLTARFPRHEDYGLKPQMNRAVNSISLNIAEGSAKSNKSFAYYLETSVGSAFEVIGSSFLSLDRGYISKEEQLCLYQDGERLAKSINAFRKTLQDDS